MACVCVQGLKGLDTMHAGSGRACEHVEMGATAPEMCGHGCVGERTARFGKVVRESDARVPQAMRGARDHRENLRHENLRHENLRHENLRHEKNTAA